MTKRKALFGLGSLTLSALTLQVTACCYLWKRQHRHLAKALLASGAALDALFLYSFLVPNFPLTGRIFHHGNRQGDSIALTFDDGPREPYTGQILDILKREKVPATFFVLGENALRFPDTIKRMEAEGHSVANHGMDHNILMFATAAAGLDQLKRAEAAIRGSGVREPAAIFRAPHGWLSPAAHGAIRSAGYQIAGWTKGVWDTANPGADRIVSRTIDLLKPGNILLLHDGWAGTSTGERQQTVAAVPAIIEKARDAGLRFVTLNQMLAEAGSP